jgi:hypothetical protein
MRADFPGHGPGADVEGSLHRGPRERAGPKRARGFARTRKSTARDTPGAAISRRARAREANARRRDFARALDIAESWWYRTLKASRRKNRRLGVGAVTPSRAFTSCATFSKSVAQPQNKLAVFIRCGADWESRDQTKPR